MKVTTQSMDMSALGGSGVQIRIKGERADVLSAIARILRSLWERQTDCWTSLTDRKNLDSEFRVVINKAKAMEHQLTVAQVYQEVQKRLAEASRRPPFHSDQRL